MARRQSKWFVITNWNCNDVDDYEKIMKEHQIRFMAWGQETCPNTRRSHHQAYLYFIKAKGTGKTTLNKIGKMFGPTHCFVEPMYGRIRDNEIYCGKEKYLNKLGDEPAQGCREDLNECKEEIMAGRLSADDIFLENPTMGHMYGRTLDRLENIYLQRQFRTHMTKGIWYVGASGSGKSRKAFKDFHPETHFVKDLTVSWWCGYKPLQHKTVILNDFRGSCMPLADLLTLVDGCPRSVKIRGAQSIPFLAETVIVTSIFTPTQCYKGAIENDGEAGEQLDRRFLLEYIESSGCSASSPEC